MKRKISAFASIAALLMAGVAMTSSAPYNASNNNEGTTSVIPEALAEKIISAARDNQFITAEEAMTLSETGAIQQCFDAFVASGYGPLRSNRQTGENLRRSRILQRCRFRKGCHERCRRQGSQGRIKLGEVLCLNRIINNSDARWAQLRPFGHSSCLLSSHSHLKKEPSSMVQTPASGKESRSN